MWAFHYGPLWSETYAVSVADTEEQRWHCRGLKEWEVSTHSRFWGFIRFQLFSCTSLWCLIGRGFRPCLRKVFSFFFFQFLSTSSGRKPSGRTAKFPNISRRTSVRFFISSECFEAPRREGPNLDASTNEQRKKADCTWLTGHAVTTVTPFWLSMEVQFIIWIRCL